MSDDAPAVDAPSLDRLFESAHEGDAVAFGDWAARVERSIRASLRPYAQAADVEMVLQETLLRMWEVARAERRLEGEFASLRYALRVARNMALKEARRMRTLDLLSIDHLTAGDEPAVLDSPPTDHLLRKHIEECVQALPDKLRMAIQQRIELSPAPDREIAERLGVAATAFRQWICRARKALAACLQAKGVSLSEMT